jgi:phosphoglycolate phosphatase
MKRVPQDWPLAVVFDLDGTLIDSAGDLADALNHTLGLRGFKPLPVAQVKQMVGGGIPKLVERGLRAHGVPDVELLPIAADFLNYYRNNLVRHTTLYEGAAELLERLKCDGRRLGLCTNKQHQFTMEIVEKLGIAKYFIAINGEREGQPRKPDPTPLLSVLHALGVSPQDAVMVGDMSADVDCAKAAEVVPVAVRYGYARVRPEELGAAAIIDRLADLPGCLARLSAAEE